MALVHDQNKNNFTSVEGKKPRDMSISRPTLASIESLAIPLVSSLSVPGKSLMIWLLIVTEFQAFRIVVIRDNDVLMGSSILGCKCNLQIQEVVFLADFRCAKCQQRVAEVMSKMNG